MPERIEDPNESVPLSWEIVKIEEFKARHPGRAKSRFNVSLVAKDLEFPRCHKEIMSLISHVVLPESFPEDLEILSPENAGVFLDLREVRISAPLSNLMAYNRLVILGDYLAEIVRRLWGFFVYDARKSVTPHLNPGLVSDVEVAFRDLRPSSSTCVDSA